MKESDKNIPYNETEFYKHWLLSEYDGFSPVISKVNVSLVDRPFTMIVVEPRYSYGKLMEKMDDKGFDGAQMQRFLQLYRLDELSINGEFRYLTRAENLVWAHVHIDRVAHNTEERFYHQWF